MSFIINTPTIPVQVFNEYLGLNELGSTSGYLSNVKSVDGNVLMFSVYLDTGAMFSNLPIEALYCRKYPVKDDVFFSTKELQPYSCLDGDINIIEISLLRHCPVVCRINDNSYNGVYLFTIDYNGTDLADVPEQRKTHNIIQLSNGQLAALPNNHCLFLNDSLTNNRAVEYPKYKRSTKYYVPGS